MNSAELSAAAARIEAAATQRQAWAKQTRDPAYAALYEGVAQQLRDRASQVRSWARNLTHYERKGQDIPADIAAYIEGGTREFLAMAEG